jgi:cobalt-precorrin 5A hydrolase/precorrin-3B C17-methyltransferase
MVKPAIFILGVSALPLAKKVKSSLGGEIHGPRRVGEADVAYTDAASHLAELFRDHRAIIGLCASGILIRALAHALRDKHDEPPVIAIAEDGSSIVPLLGGHHGANALARRLAQICGGHAAITTASDIRFGGAFDEPPEGHVLANEHDVKAAAAAKLAGETIRINVTEKAIAGGPKHLVYHPKVLAIGVGCERGVSADRVLELIEESMSTHKLAKAAVACVTSIHIKSDEAAIHAAAEYLNVPARFFGPHDLARETPRLKNPSELVAREVGTPGVAEAAALAAAGPDADLIVEKIKRHGVTIAIAKSSSPILRLRGQQRGKLSVVGIGPGAAEWRSLAARATLTAASDWVGYGLYLDLVADLRDEQTEHRFPLGAEEDRVRHAIALAKQGKHVALVCSGDAGIYAMASLVYEIVEREPNRIAIEVIPGISAFQAAAAKAGAIIGHDFCCISLSDLLTPWPEIERRIAAAAEGDFVVAFYNPRSAQRATQLRRALDVLASHRPPQTPVVVATNLGRPGEDARIIPLGEFDPNTVDMLTIVIVGSSQSRAFKRGDGRTYVYTPRGYAAKREAAE